MRESDEVIAILCSDLHLTLMPPSCRAEKDWLGVQKRYLDELSELSERHRAPVICAGDLFDHWKTPPELINWTWDALPNDFYAIPGQHDLPLHSYSDIKKSGFFTLVKGNRIKNLEYLKPIKFDRFVAWGFPWGFDPLKKELKSKPTKPKIPNLAVVHSYCWAPKHTYPNAPASSHWKKHARALEGFQAAVFGDNHQGFLTPSRNLALMNCGTFIRRKSDEVEYNPRVGLFLASGNIKDYLLDTSKDEFNDRKENDSVSNKLKSDEFIKSMSQMITNSGFDVRKSIEQYCHKHEVDERIVSILIEALENER